MADKRNQSPHYIPELDRGADSSFVDVMFAVTYPLTTVIAAMVLFSQHDMLAGIFVICAGLLMMIISFLFLRDGPQKKKKAKTGAEPAEREQGPHYIPELDPANPRRTRNNMHGQLWFSLIGCFASFTGAFVFSNVGVDWLVHALIATGIIFLSPWLVFASVPFSNA